MSNIQDSEDSDHAAMSQQQPLGCILFFAVNRGPESARAAATAVIGSSTRGKADGSRGKLVLAGTRLVLPESMSGVAF